MTSNEYATSVTPAGPFTAIIDADGAVLASGWTTDAENLRQLIHPSLRPAAIRESRSLGPVSAAIEKYHQGEIGVIDVSSGQANS